MAAEWPIWHFHFYRGGRGVADPAFLFLSWWPRSGRTRILIFIVSCLVSIILCRKFCVISNVESSNPSSVPYALRSSCLFNGKLFLQPPRNDFSMFLWKSLIILRKKMLFIGNALNSLRGCCRKNSLCYFWKPCVFRRDP